VVGTGPSTEQTWSIDADFVARANPHLATAEVDGEAVVYDPKGPFRIPLNRSAALIWASIDGGASLAEISAELAGLTDAPVDTVFQDVINVVADLAARGIVLVADLDYPAPEPFSDPTPLRSDDFQLPSEAALTVRVGALSIGVRSNDAPLLERLTDLLSPRVVERESRARLSIVSNADRGRIRGLRHLYRDDELVLTTPSDTRLLRAALAHLAGFLPPPPGTIPLNATLLTGKSGAVVVGGDYLEHLDGAGRRLARAGWERHDGPRVLVDNNDLQCVVIENPLGLESTSTESLDRLLPLQRGECARPGRYQLRDILMVGAEPDAAKVESPAQQVAGLIPLVRDFRGSSTSEAVEFLWSLAAHTSIHWIHGLQDGDMLRELDRLGGHTPRPVIPLPR
jgi:Coenzyme PQQ synthesis protein D (PqqD)